MFKKILALSFFLAFTGCDTGFDVVEDEGAAGASGATNAAGSAGSAGAPGGGGQCLVGQTCVQSCNNAFGKTLSCCAVGSGAYNLLQESACNGDGHGKACVYGEGCSGNPYCGNGLKCCGGKYQSASDPACGGGNGQGGGSGVAPDCVFGASCSGSPSCNNGLKCCGGAYHSPNDAVCGGSNGGQGGSGGNPAPTCNLGDACTVEGATCPDTAFRCCDGVITGNAVCGNPPQGTASGVCMFTVELLNPANFKHVFVQGAGVVSKSIDSLEGSINGGPVNYIPSTPPVSWGTLGNCDAEKVKGESLNLNCSVPRSQICGSAADCALAFQVYAVMSDGQTMYFGCNTAASPFGPSVFKLVQANCGDGMTVFATNGGEGSGKTVPKFADQDLSSQVCVE